ncbi:MAG TPA: protein kinase [Nannocystis sp.]|jgi:serine/threonine-protein kinase
MKPGAFDESSTAHPVAISEDLLASPPAVFPGQLLGDRYHVGERIGGGGMADVFRARDPYLYRDVAIKVIKPGMASGEMCGRMLQEGRATAAIDHPHLLRVLDFGRVGATVYLVTDLLRGCSLAEHLRSLADARLGWREAIELLLPALDALAQIHDRGFVHRDLKPDNLFVHHRDGREALIVLDLGIAKVSPAFRGGGALNTTESGRVLGTPAYMSPEQAGGKPLDHRTDVYSIGVTLYRMLAGRLPFEARAGEGPIVLMAHHLYDPPPRLDEVVPGLPAPLVEVVMRSLAKAPAERPQTMRALAQALREALPAEPAGDAAAPTVARVKRTRSVGWLSGGVVLLAALILLRGVQEVAATPAVAGSPLADDDGGADEAEEMEMVRPSSPSFTLALLPDRPPVARAPSVALPERRGSARRKSPHAGVARVLAGVADGVGDCIERRGGLDQETLQVTWDVRPDGRVIASRLPVGTRTTLAGCVQALVSGLQFPPGTGLHVEHTFKRAPEARRP